MEASFKLNMTVCRMHPIENKDNKSNNLNTGNEMGKEIKDDHWCIPTTSDDVPEAGNYKLNISSKQKD